MALMNIYQEDLGRIARLKLENGKVAEDFLSQTFKELQELVDKLTPKKVILVSETERIKRAGYTHKCPVCESSVGTITRSLRIEPNNYCCFCG